MADLFGNAAKTDDYDASNIEVLEGLEPVRHRPGMYIGGTDDRALHHLAAEILDNSMDEAVAGHASRIDVHLERADRLTIRDNGRGMPTDEHPKFPGKSAVEVILTTLHAGGKFSGKAYATSGGLHGVGASVVNALSSNLIVEIVRDKTVYQQQFSRGKPITGLAKIGTAPNRRGTSVTFTPDNEIFGDNVRFRPSTLFRMARSKAYLFAGVEIRWRCDPVLINGDDNVPAESVLHYPGGMADFLNDATTNKALMISSPFAESAENDGQKFEWAITWLGPSEDGFFQSYCNTVPTPSGGTHETGFRQAIVRGLRSFGDLTGNRKAADITADDALSGSAVMLSVFLRDPQFQGQTKDRLVSAEATRQTEMAVRDRFDHWLAADSGRATFLLEAAIERSEERKRRKKEKEVARKSATRRLRLPGKLADCTSSDAELTELFLVEGDSAGGTAIQGRDRNNQAIMPLRGKILNVEKAMHHKIFENEEIKNIYTALGVSLGTEEDERALNLSKLRYHKVVIMCDADVDGSHIETLILTFFFRHMKELIEKGYVYIATPPLYLVKKGSRQIYAWNDDERDRIIEQFKGTTGSESGIGVQRYKGLGEMNAEQLWDTTLNPENRTLRQVTIENAAACDHVFSMLMGDEVPPRRAFIEENAKYANIDI